MTLTRLAALLIIATIAGAISGAWGALWLADLLTATTVEIPAPNGTVSLLSAETGQIETWRWWDVGDIVGAAPKCWLGPAGAWFDSTGVKLPISKEKEDEH